MSNRYKKIFTIVIAVVLSFAVSMLFTSLDGVKEIENRTWDWRSKLVLPYNTPDPNIRLIEVDQSSLDAQAEEGITWPWPRSRYINIIKFLEAAGAKGLAFDILFTEESSYGKQDDLLFSRAFRSDMPILSILALSQSLRHLDENRFEVLAKDLFEHDQKTSYNAWALKQYPGIKQKYSYNSVIMPIREILQEGKFIGNSSADPDSDGVMRHYTLGGSIRDVIVLNSPFAFYFAVEGKSATQKKIANFFDRQGQLAVKFSSDGRGYHPVSAEAVIRSYDQIAAGETPVIALSEFKDKWVYLGLTAAGLFDLKPTPINKRGKAVEFLATVLDNILNDDFIIKVDNRRNALTAFLVSLLVAASVVFNAKLRNQMLLLTLIIGVFLFAIYMSALKGIWLSFTWPFFSLILSLLISMAGQFYLEGRQHRFIRNAFRYYVSPSLIEEIVKNPETLSLGGERKELTIFFSDIAGFTSISEKLKASELVALMNSFLSEMTEIIQKHNGTVDKYIGDAIVAFWNAPVGVKEHAYMAVSAALECQKKLQELNEVYQKKFGVLLKLRIGINTAVVNVGNFGSKDRFSYTVLGDGVNLAARLEGANKYFGTYLLITEATRKALTDKILSRKVASIKVVGKNELINVFEPYLTGSELSKNNLQEYQKAIQAFDNKQLEESLNIFKRIQTDPVAQAYILRLERDLEKGDYSNWSAVWSLTEK